MFGNIGVIIRLWAQSTQLCTFYTFYWKTDDENDALFVCFLLMEKLQILHLLF